MEELRLRAAALCVWAALALGAGPAHADRLVLKDGKIAFGTITSEKDSLIKYFDRFDRPRKIAAAKVDTINYDAEDVRGLVKVTFRKGQPKDRTGYFRLRYADELDLDVEYHTDSISELDLFFKNNVHVRVLPDSRFKVIKAPKSYHDPLQLDLYTGRVLVTSAQGEALARVSTPFGVGVGRGIFQTAVRASPQDSSIMVFDLRGLAGVQENLQSPGELVVDEGKAMSFAKKQGQFEASQPDSAEIKAFSEVAANMGHYSFSEIEYPKIGYLPKAITGLGFMVFFYGSAIGILDYVNHI